MSVLTTHLQDKKKGAIWLDNKDFSDKEFLEKLDIDQIRRWLESIEERQFHDVKTFFDEFKELLPESLKKQYKELYKDMKGIIKLYRKEQTEIIGSLLSLEIFKEPFKEMSWPHIKEQYDNELDLNEKIKMLLGITNQRQVCKERQCKIFPGISEAQKVLSYLEFTTLEAAEESLGFEDFRKYKSTYFLIKKLLDLTFIEIFRLSTVHDTVRANKAKEHEEWRDDVWIADKARKEKKGLISNLGGGPENFIERKYPNRDPTKSENAFTEEGKRNAAALTDKFGPNLDGLRKKSKERTS